MASGLIASTVIAAEDTWQLIATLPNNTIVYNIHILNKTGSPVTYVWIAPMSTQATGGPLASEEFESELGVSPQNSFLMSGLVSGATSYVWIKSSKAGPAVNVYGIE